MRTASLGAAVILAFSANVYASYMDNIRARCVAYGATPGTRDFYECMHDLNLERQKQASREKLALTLSCSAAPQAGLSAAGIQAARPWTAETAALTHLVQAAEPGC